MPIVSILVPVYNRELLIARTLQSALAQTVPDIEVVVVDNQSTDRTFDVVAAMAEQDKRIKLFRNPENLGPVRNWMKCAEYASAPYAKILFSDDLMAPTYIERTLPHLLSPDCALVYTPAMVGHADWTGGVRYKAFLSLSGYMTPHSVHYGLAVDLRVLRQATLDAAFLANPNRFKNRPPQLPPMPTAAWINPPPEEKKPTTEPVGRTLN